MIPVIGLDVGGANTKGVWRDGVQRRVVSRRFEVWRDRDALESVLRAVVAEAAQGRVEAVALTTTAELSDAFRTKREGVGFVLDAAEAAFRGRRLLALTTDGELVSFAEARTRPLAVAAAIYVSQMARPRIREVIKPAIELLSSIPSVVVGAFALLAMATVLQNLFGYQTRLNAFVAGIALGFAVIPIVFSISEDALTSVPASYTQAALALGSSRWQAAWQVVLPAALPGVFAATVLGFGRAIGETMIVLMVCSASVMSWSIFESARSITTTIAAEMGEVVNGGHHYRILFMLGSLLFAVTFLSNMTGDIIVHRFKRKLEGKR